MRLRHQISRVDTQTLVVIPIILGLLCMGVYIFSFRNYSGSFNENLLIFLIFFFFGASGIPMIIRKEALGSFGFGFSAIIQGTIILLLGWGIAFGSVIYKILSGH